MMDQAERLRNIIKQNQVAPAKAARVITVTSGKGGVGKSNVSINLAVEFKKMGKRVIILSVLSPVPVMNFKWADTILFGYSYSPYTFKALFGALNGEYEPQGILPLK